jgi:hypothetical protein
MAGARDDRGSPERASLGAGANELSTRVGEKGVHERVNSCGAGDCGILPAGGAAGGYGRRTGLHMPGTSPQMSCVCPAPGHARASEEAQQIERECVTCGPFAEASGPLRDDITKFDRFCYTL